MKEWANKPTTLLQTSSSPLVTTSRSSLVQTSGVSSSGSLGSSSALSKSALGIKTVSETTVSKLSTTGTLLSRTALTSPLAGGVVAGVAGVGIYGIGNIVSYAKKKKTGKQAIGDTVKDSSGLGVSAGVGVLAGKAIAGTFLTFGSAALVPVATGLTAMYFTKKAWNKLFSKKQKAELSAA